ncbi:MAG TPA: nicotinate-nucleotide--dimethylbenzimidazole phosphoribosyltransferase [Kofleriaceae bacterium]
MLLDHILSSILPASGAMQAAATATIERRLPQGESLGKLGAAAGRLAAARHSPRPALTARAVIVCAADHGVAWPGIDLGADGPAAAALRLIAAGESAVSAAARTAGAAQVLVDAGVKGGDRVELGRGVLSFRLADGTASILEGPAMPREVAEAGLSTGIALAISLADATLDLVALGQIGPGSEVASGALIAALTGTDPAAIAPDDADTIARALAANPIAAGEARDDPTGALAALGGLEIAIQTGIILACASIHVPVVLDDYGTWAAALVAARLAPHTAGYLFAAHAGGRPGYRAALAALGVEPIFDLGLSHGEGTGALLAVPLLDAASRVLGDLSQ